MRLRGLTFSNVISLLALIVALGGTAYAAATISGRDVVNGSLTGLDIRNNSLTGSDIKGDAVNSDDIEDGSVTAQDLHDPLPPGATGATGAKGDMGATGAKGDTGVTSAKGDTGGTGPSGATGPTGLAGTNGTNGTNAIVEYAEFYALMLPDNAATVAVGGAVDFPQDGAQSGTIVRTSSDTYLLPVIGTYRVTFSVPVTEAGQLRVRLDGIELPHTTSGRDTGSSTIDRTALVTTTVANSIIQVVNPTLATTALTITPNAGGGVNQPSAASLIIERLS